jgi:hypothetical protein
MVVGFPCLRFWAVSVAPGHGNHGFPMVVLLGGFRRGRTWKPLGFSRLCLGGFHCGRTWKPPTHGRFCSRSTWKPRISSQLHWFSIAVVHGNPEFHRKLSTPTQRKSRPQVRRHNAHPQRKHKARPHIRKLGTPTQRKARPQDGHPNAKLIRNENVHTREH